MSSPRRSFSLIKFPGRSGSLPLAVTSEESEGHTARYFVSEDQRNDIFHASQQDFQNEFSREEADQYVGERTRSSEFNQTLTQFDKAFQADHQRQQDIYKETDARQEEIYRFTQNIRESTFSEGQKSRAEAFKTEQETRVQRSEWHSSARGKLLEKLRQKWEESLATLDTQLAEQFSNLLKRQEEDFLDDECRRNAIIEKMIKEDKVRIRASDDLASREPQYPPTIVLSPSPGHPLSRPPSRRSSRSRSRSPRRFLPESYPGPPMPVPIIPAPASYPSPARVSSPSDASRNPVLRPNDGNETIGEPKEAGPTLGSEDSSERKFESAERAREQVFLGDEQHRQGRFEAAEAMREAAEAKRSNVFRKKEDSWSTKSQAMLEAHESEFKGREELRTQQGATRQDAIFKAAQERRQQIFDLLMSQIEKQAEAEERLEEDLAEHQKSAIQALYRKQSVQLDTARENRRYRFRQAQMRRDEELAVEPSPIIPHKDDAWISPVPSRYARHYPEVYIPAGHGRTPLARSPSLASYGFPERYEVGRRFSPPTGFGTQALFRGGANIQDVLPVAGSDDPDIQALRQELKFVNIQRKHQHQFEKSQKRREEQFERGVRRRHRVFLASEAKRVEKFEKEQRRRKEKFEDGEDLRQVAFQKAQQHREALFLAAEQRREADFYEKDASRDDTFKQAQVDRAERFHSKQMSLQKKCFEAGKKRIEDLDVWGLRLVEERERKENKYFEDDRRNYEYVFKLSLGSYVSKN